MEIIFPSRACAPLVGKIKMSNANATKHTAVIYTKKIGQRCRKHPLILIPLSIAKYTFLRHKLPYCRISLLR